MATLLLVNSVNFTDGVTAGKDVDGQPLIGNDLLHPLKGRLAKMRIGFLNGLPYRQIWQPHYYNGVTSSMDVDGPRHISPGLTERQRPLLRRGGGAPFALGRRTYMLPPPKYYNGVTLGRDQDGTLQPEPVPGTYRFASVARCKSGFFSFVAKYLMLPGLFKTISDHLLTDPKQRS